MTAYLIGSLVGSPGPGFFAACHPVASAGPFVLHGAAPAEFSHISGAVHAEIVAAFRPGGDRWGSSNLLRSFSGTFGVLIAR